MIFYALLTYGKKPSGSILTHPAAQSQLRYYRKFVSHNGIQNTRLIYDYARKIKSLRSLSELSANLAKLESKKAGKVYIDDIARLLKGCKLRCRVDFLEELRVYGARIYSMQHRKCLEDFSGVMLQALVQFPEQSKHPGQQVRCQETQAARNSSTEVRSAYALENARALAAVRDEIVAVHGAATLKQISDEATARGLTSTRGKNWTPQNVARSLKLLESKGNGD